MQNALARASAEEVTVSMARCCRLVMRYLVGTKNLGIENSPKVEKDFQNSIHKLKGHPENEKATHEQLQAPVATYTDASFGTTYKKLRSVTGVCIFLYGCCVCWKTSVQTVFAKSTTESEFTALSDGVEMEEDVYALLEFLYGKPPPEGPLFCDNRSAVVCVRKGTENTAEIPRRTRHVALRHAHVLPRSHRVWFVPTDQQRADGMTKSSNAASLQQVVAMLLLI